MSVTLTAQATLSGAHSITVTVKNISDNNTVSTIGWTDTSAGWHEANQYIQLNYQSNEVGWGVRIYTDNYNAAANPQYTGNTYPAYAGTGMVGVSDPTSTVSMGWVALSALGARPAILTNGDGTLQDNKRWVYVMDKHNPTFDASLDYTTVVKADGMALNDGVIYWQTPVSSPVYIYTICDFSGASNQTYRTNMLTVELYYQ